MRCTNAPHCARDLEMTAQPQQRALAYPPTLADRLHQAIAVVGLPGAAALDRGAADIHGATLTGRAGTINRDKDDYGTTFRDS
jgi:hypothetical protein